MNFISGRSLLLKLIYNLFYLTNHIFLLLTDDEMLIDGFLDSMASTSSLGLAITTTRAILNKRYLRRYWLLVLEPNEHVQRTYKRLGVAVAICRRIDKGKTLEGWREGSNPLDLVLQGYSHRINRSG